MCAGSSFAAVLASIGNAAASASVPQRFPAANTKVASGTWDGTSWTLSAGETASPTSFYYCARVQLGTPITAAGWPAREVVSGRPVCTCQRPLPPRLRLWHRLRRRRGLPQVQRLGGYRECANAAEVTFTLKGGTTITVDTFASPPGFAPSLRFWALETPCGEDITAIKAHR